MDIIRFSPGCIDLSGYYWIESNNGTPVEVSQSIHYCIMNASDSDILFIYIYIYEFRGGGVLG